jgi:hypothetical protein
MAWMVVNLVILLCICTTTALCLTGRPLSCSRPSTSLYSSLMGTGGSLPNPSADPVLTNIDDLEDAEPNKASIGLQQYFEIAIGSFAKTPIYRLRELIKKYSVDGDKRVFPLDENDIDSYVEDALSTLWQHTQGSWDTLLDIVDSELKGTVESADAAIIESHNSLNSLKEGKIKDLIIKYESRNAIPKLDKSKYVGKFTKADYIASLMDLLRNQNGNDYVKVAEILASEKQEKKGFS